MFTLRLEGLRLSLPRRVFQESRGLSRSEQKIPKAILGKPCSISL